MIVRAFVYAGLSSDHALGRTRLKFDGYRCALQGSRRRLVGAGDRIRTDNIQLGKLAFYIELRPPSGRMFSKSRIALVV